MKPASLVRGIVAGPLMVAAAVGLYASPAFAAAQVQHQNGDITGMEFPLGPSPVDLPSSCQFNPGFASFLFTSGTGVFHETDNNNGSWGGETLQGQAVFYLDSTPVDQGHLTVWEGGGDNYPNHSQSEGGLTLTFNGATVQIHVSGHMTTNAQGTPTAEIENVQISCS